MLDIMRKSYYSLKLDVTKSEENMNKKHTFKRIMAVALMLMLMLVLTYFKTYESAHELHHCTGSDCPICHELRIAESVVKQLSVAVIFSFSIILPFFSLIQGVHQISGFVSKHTLVSDKVRLDN